VILVALLIYDPSYYPRAWADPSRVARARAIAEAVVQVLLMGRQGTPPAARHGRPSRFAGMSRSLCSGKVQGEPPRARRARRLSILTMRPPQQIILSLGSGQVGKPRAGAAFVWGWEMLFDQHSRLGGAP